MSDAIRDVHVRNLATKLNVLAKILQEVVGLVK